MSSANLSTPANVNQLITKVYLYVVIYKLPVVKVGGAENKNHFIPIIMLISIVIMLISIIKMFILITIIFISISIMLISIVIMFISIIIMFISIVIMFTSFIIMFISIVIMFISSIIMFIDNILTNKPQDLLITGALLRDISDHLPIFFVSKMTQKKIKQNYSTTSYRVMTSTKI